MKVYREAMNFVNNIDCSLRNVKFIEGIKLDLIFLAPFRSGIRNGHCQCLHLINLATTVCRSFGKLVIRLLLDEISAQET